jgi:NAD-dependent SIR2 family protein deacetylase
MQWAFYARHLQDVLYSHPPRPEPYIRLKAITEHASRWVLTSNADNLFPRMGFDPERLWTRQGTYANLQCLRPCCEAVWESAPYVERLMPKVDHTTGELSDRSAVPRCPRCRGDMMLNVRGGSWFVEKPYELQGRRFNEWLGAASKGQFLIIEIGAGYSTPSVIRWPCEALAANSPNAHLIRVNLHHPEAHDSLHGRSTCIAARGATVLSMLLPQLQDLP